MCWAGSGFPRTTQGGDERCRQLLAERNRNENIRQVRDAFVAAPGHVISRTFIVFWVLPFN
jgi:hypothetical protein